MRRVAAVRGPKRPRPAFDAAVAAARLFRGPGSAGLRRVPLEERRELTQGQIALELLTKRVRKAGLAEWWWPIRLTGSGGPFRRELETRGLHYVVGVTEQMIVFAEQPPWEWPDPAVQGRSVRGPI